MDKITNNLYIGNLKDACNQLELNLEGINLVLNTAKDLNNLPWFDGIQSIKIGLMDHETPENKDMYSWGGLILYESLKQGKKVLVHCYEGKSRSTAISTIGLSLFFWKNLRKIKTIDEIIQDTFNKIVFHRPVCKNMHEGHRKEIKPTLELLITKVFPTN